MVVALLYISEGSLGFIEFDDAPTIMITQKMICFTLIKIHNCKIRIIEGFFHKCCQCYQNKLSDFLKQLQKMKYL